MKVLQALALASLVFSSTVVVSVAVPSPAFAQDASRVQLEAPFGVTVNADGSLSYFQKSATQEGVVQAIDEMKFRWLQDNLGKSIARSLCKLNVVPKSVGVSLGVVSVDWDLSVLCRVNGGWN